MSKHEDILSAVREEIVRGRYAPGAMLLTRTEYEARYDATAPTVQKAFDRLREDGFIEVRHRVGTFVSARPPHLNRYGLVFPHHPGVAGRWSRFHEALRSEAERLSVSNTGKTFEFYYGAREGAVGDMERLATDVAANRVAGLIHAAVTPHIFDLRLRHPDAPPTVVGSPDLGGGQGILFLDYESVLERGAAYLANAGCRRIAVLEDLEGLGRSALPPKRQAILARHGLQVAANGYMPLPASAAETARYWVKLLVSQADAVRPDGLLIMDDTFAEPVCVGLAEAGVKVPGDLRVVTHNNYPLPITNSLPIHVLGFHAGRILESAISYIDSRKQGKQPDDVMRFEAMTEAESKV